MAIRIVPGDLGEPGVAGLLRIHLATARAQTAPGSAHALDLSGLRSPDISLWAAWEGETPLGVGALKRLSPDHGEVKSMHTAEAARRKGVGGALLRHIIAAARDAGLSRLSLETGSWPYFHPAHALYRRHGFVECLPFAGYAPDPNSVFPVARPAAALTPLRRCAPRASLPSTSAGQGADAASPAPNRPDARSRGRRCCDVT